MVKNIFFGKLFGIIKSSRLYFLNTGIYGINQTAFCLII